MIKTSAEAKSQMAVLKIGMRIDLGSQYFNLCQQRDEINAWLCLALSISGGEHGLYTQIPGFTSAFISSETQTRCLTSVCSQFLLP